MKRSIVLSILLTSLLTVTALPLWSQQSPPAKPMHGQEGMQAMQGMQPREGMEGMKSEQPRDQESMAAQCQAMMARHQSMMAELQAAQQRLDDLAAQMDAASGAEKVDAMAAVVKELVKQQRLRQTEMMEMHPQMMHHAMEHMRAMGESGGMGSMMDCPMMQGTSASPPPSDEPSKHHPSK